MIIDDAYYKYTVLYYKKETNQLRGKLPKQI
jgi:hypothetical protein